MAGLDRYWTGHSDVADHENKIAPVRARIQHIRDNPVEYVGVGNHGESVDEVVAKAERLLNGMLREADADAVTERWARTEQWRRLSDRYLPPGVYDEWSDARLRKSLPR